MRARNLKPGFFKNEALVELPFETRLLFAGLWCMADREGKLEDRPKRIKMEIFPGDNVDIEQMLCRLDDAGLILRYEVNAERYIAIPKFLKHQTPHHREAPSTIPGLELARLSPGQAQGETEASLGQDLGESEPRHGRAVLNPESPFLNPESSPCRESISSPDPPVASERCPHEAIIDAYHERLPMLPRVKAWGELNRKELRARWRESAERQSLKWWADYFSSVSGMPFLVGDNDRGWTASLGWLVKAANLAKVLNGAYKSREPPPSAFGMGKAGEATWKSIQSLRAMEAQSGKH